MRTQWLLTDNGTIASLFLVTLLLRAVLLALESLQKWRDDATLPDGVSREMMQGIFAHTFLWWLNPLFKIGYKRDITMDDLFETDRGLKGDVLGARLLRCWEKGTSSASPRKTGSANFVNQWIKHASTALLSLVSGRFLPSYCWHSSLGWRLLAFPSASLSLSIAP